jgi:arylsulfatase
MKIRLMITIFLVILFSLSVEPAESRPNIVLIFMDNFGYGELGVYGGGITRVVSQTSTLRRSVHQAVLR